MMTNQRYSKTTSLILCGLFAAVTAVCSFITIPLGFTPIPLNLGTFAVFLTGGILGKKYGTVSILVYVLLGAVGIPVFSGFRGGPGVLAGPTGGYIVGYIAAVFVIGLLTDAIFSAGGAGSAKDDVSAGGRTFGKTALCICALVLGTAICYLMGTLWFMISTGSRTAAALTACILPFLPGDVLKIALAGCLIGRFRTLLF